MSDLNGDYMTYKEAFIEAVKRCGQTDEDIDQRLKQMALDGYADERSNRILAPEKEEEFIQMAMRMSAMAKKFKDENPEAAREMGQAHAAYYRSQN